MKHQSILVSISFASALFAIGCASQPAAPTADATAAPLASAKDEPAAPPLAAVVPTAPEQPAADAKKEGIPGIADKLRKNRLTQYWRDTDTYTYFVGAAFEATYIPGKTLSLRDDSQENGVTCRFEMDGKLQSPADAADKSRCETLMLTVDQQLGN